MIFPSEATNNGSANLGANQTVESDWFTFRGPPGDENFWLVWSVTPVTQLESAKIEAFKHPKGGLTGQTLVTVKEFLRTKALEVKVTVYNYKATKPLLRAVPVICWLRSFNLNIVSFRTSQPFPHREVNHPQKNILVM